MKPLEKLKNSQRGDSPRKWKCLPRCFLEAEGSHRFKWNCTNSVQKSIVVLCGNQIQLKTVTNPQNHWTIQVGNNHGDHLVQLPAKSRANFKMHASYLGPSMKIPKPLWPSCSVFINSLQWGYFPCIYLKFLSLQVVIIVHYLLPMHYASLRKLMSFSNSRLSTTIRSHFSDLLPPQNRANLSNTSIHTVCSISLPILVG